MALTVPLRVTATPVPLADGLMVPEMLSAGPDPLDAVKLTPVTLAVVSIVLWLEGVKLRPFLLGLSV